MGFEKYEPQVKQSTLINEINANYAATIVYYKKRQELFQNVLKQRANETLDSFENSINEMIEKAWQEKVFKILQEIYFDKTKSLEEKQDIIKTKFSTSQFEEEYINAIKQPNYPLFKGKMGLTFEKFIKDEIFDKYIEQVVDFSNSHLESLVTGAKTSLSSVVQGSKNIRADLLISTGVELEKENGILMGDNLPLELQRKLEINWENALPSFDNEMGTSDSGILNSFLSNDSFFGFSAKVYNAEEDNKHFSQSSVIRKALNEVFWHPYKSNGGHSNRHSWEVDYAETYVIWNLSKILRTIISPTTIAMIYGNRSMWMSDFVSSKVFYMNIAYQTKIKDHEAKDGQIFPTINSPNIYTKNYNMAKGLTALKTVINRNKKNPFNGKKYPGIDLVLS